MAPRSGIRERSVNPSKPVTTPQTLRVIEFLANPKSYAHVPNEVRLVETHASWVFLASPYAFKIKKPVNLGFLDFTTLDLRRADCERELELNRRLAGEIYLGVVPVCDSGGKLHLGGEGEVLEWVVKMREMDPKCFLSRLISAERPSLTDMERLISRLHEFYRDQRPLPAEASSEAARRTRQSVHDNFVMLRPFLDSEISARSLAAIERYAVTFEGRHVRLFSSRVDNGWFRDCHGDLHLEHIHLTLERVDIYDCIEFNNAFRFIDVSSDLAFLAMDLDFNCRPDLARHVVERFATLLHDKGLRILNDYYKCYRACVRAKVECLRSTSETLSEEEKRYSFGRARRYVQLALRYAIAGTSPRMIVCMGRVASGKSTLAGALGAELGWPVISSDLVRKDLAGVPVNYRGAADERARLYSADMTARTYETLVARGVEALQEGQGIILDATFSQRSHRDALRKQIRQGKFPCIWIEATASETTSLDRLRQRENAPGASDARAEDFVDLSRSYEPPKECMEGTIIRVCTNGHLDASVRTMLLALAEAQACAGCDD